MHPIEPHLRETYRVADVRDLTRHLEAAGTFQFPSLPNGLFPAALAATADYEYTGYSSIWVRDNIHLAHMHDVLGRGDVAARTVESLTRFFHSQGPKLDAIIAGEADPQEVMLRPHVRFNGVGLSEVSEHWAHAQNDAIGYWIWLLCRLVAAGALPASPRDLQLLASFARYLEAIRFWEDEDSGHWEETRKVEASSIGVVTAGLLALRQLLRDRSGWAEFRHRGEAVSPEALDRLIDRGRSALAGILPAECVQDDPAKRRRYDAALLFLIYPVGIVAGELADRIVGDVVENLLGPHGIRRYIGDSYWCQDYKVALDQAHRTEDVSADMSARNRLLEPGFEAQWCIFDPVLSVIHGQQYQATRDPERLRLQVHHLNRSLRQLTGDGTPFPPLRCPESYYCEAGRYVPSDVTPLLWTQANLRLALHFMERSAQLGE
jgi:hypothetical protein